MNNWCGQWTAHALGKTGKKQVDSKLSTLIESYSLLDADAIPTRKPNEAEARKTMSDYFWTHKDELPETVRAHREAIIELIMEGISPEEAFRMVLQEI